LNRQDAEIRERKRNNEEYYYECSSAMKIMDRIDPRLDHS